MLIGYARTSTLDQVAGLEAQVRDLKAAGCDQIYQEHISAAAERAELKVALAMLREGDILVVTKLDRLARSTRNLLDIIAFVEKTKASLRILTMGMDTATPTGRLILMLLAAIAEFERSIMLERQAEGIAFGKMQGIYRGRPRSPEGTTKSVLDLWDRDYSAIEIAELTGISRISVYRTLKKERGSTKREAPGLS